MQARRAARELALILFSQLSTDFSTYSKKDFEDIILKSIRTLTNDASEELKLSSSKVLEMRAKIDDYEAEHPDNLQRPLHAKNIPVPLPNTAEMAKELDYLLEIYEKTMLALEIAEMAALGENSEVKKYILDIVTAFQKNHDFVDSQIQKYSVGWDISRMVIIDKDILRIAICELVFIKDAPSKVILDEAVELAKKYSTDDSSSFVNGILGKVAIENNLV